MTVDIRHGGNRLAMASILRCHPSRIIDASASLVPWSPRISSLPKEIIRDYPDRKYKDLIRVISALHGLDPSQVLPGNGAAELFTWAARDAAACGVSILPAPGFADYQRALRCWSGEVQEQALPLSWNNVFPQPFPEPEDADVLWLCNPHNPTGQLWSRESLEPLLGRFSLVICDEAFLPLIPDGECQSLISFIDDYSNLVVIRSLTKLLGIAGLRLGYAVGNSERLERWSILRDPWPVNSIAINVATKLLGKQFRYQSWCRKVQDWTEEEGYWMQRELRLIQGLTPLPSAANFLLVCSNHSLVALRESLEKRHHILLRDCRSFVGLGECWLRIGFQRHWENKKIIQAIKKQIG